MRSRFMVGVTFLALCASRAVGEELVQPPKLETWVGVLKEKPKDAGEKVIALFIPDAKAGGKEAPKEIALLAPPKVSPEALAQHTTDKIKPQLKVEVKGVRTTDGIEVYQLSLVGPTAGKPQYAGEVKRLPKGTKNELALGILEWEGDAGKADQPTKPLLPRRPIR